MPELDILFKQMYEWIVGSARWGAVFFMALAGLVIMFGRREIGWKRVQWILEGMLVIILAPAAIALWWYIGHAVSAAVKLK